MKLSLGRPIARLATATAAATGIPGWFIAGSIWTGAGLILIVLGLWFVLEGVTYFERQPPITPYIRTFTTHHLVIAVVVGLALVAGASAAFTHFVLDAIRAPK